MIPYPKIETLFDRDKTFKVVPGQWRLPEFEYLKNNIWYIEEKIDGTNVRVGWNHKTKSVVYGGRSNDTQMPTILLAKLQQLFPVEKFTALYPNVSMTLYGEGYGARIQKGGGNYIKDGVDFILFDVLINKWWLTRENIGDVAEKLGVKQVPILATGELDVAITMVTSGIVSTFGNFPAEGVVLRPAVQLFSRKGRRIISKLKAKDFTGKR